MSVMSTRQQEGDGDEQGEQPKDGRVFTIDPTVDDYFEIGEGDYVDLDDARTELRVRKVATGTYIASAPYGYAVLIADRKESTEVDGPIVRVQSFGEMQFPGAKTTDEVRLREEQVDLALFDTQSGVSLDYAKIRDDGTGRFELESVTEGEVIFQFELV